MEDVADDAQQAENATSTPNSNGAAPTNSNSRHVVKDRPCPFCGQAFTSSSLGRHLDLYIKPHNPKPPDGIHDVDEIQKMRGGITRRQPRNGPRSASGGGSRFSRSRGQEVNDASTPTNSRNKPFLRNLPGTGDGGSGFSPREASEPNMVSATFKGGPRWQATGIIDNSSSRDTSRGNDRHHDTTGHQAQRVDMESESMWKLQEAAEVGRAAEMALREVLGSLEAARKRTEPIQLFEDFDFFALSFPGLVLALTPPPPTLFSAAPFASADSWTILPPGHRQYEVTNRHLNECIIARRLIEHLPDSLTFKYHSHLSGAWEHWQSMTDHDRNSAWALEILRALTRSHEQKQRYRSELEASQQHVRHLEAEYDRLSRCQLPREYLMHPPNTLPVPAEILREARPFHVKSNHISADYDADSLITKWRSTVRETMRSSSRVAQSPGLDYGQAMSRLVESERRPPGNMVMNGSMWSVNGPTPRSAHDGPGSAGDDDNAYMSFRNPNQPSAMAPVSVDDGAGDEDDDEGSDADADGEPDLDSSGMIPNPAEPHPTMTTRRHMGAAARPNPNLQTANGTMNGNGKRPLAPTPTSGRPYKVYKERQTE